MGPVSNPDYNTGVIRFTDSRAEMAKVFLRPEHPADVKREYIIEDKFQMNKWQDLFHKHRIYIPDEERYTVSF